MNNRSKRYPNPKFGSIEEEDKYWETHSPLDEGFEGEVETSEQKRSSFLSVRMTGDELSQLRDEAVKMGLGPSTYARLVLTHQIEPKNCFPPRPLMRNKYLYCSPESKLKHPEICILKTDDQNNDLNIDMRTMIEMIRTVWKCRVVSPDDDDYERLEQSLERSGKT